MNHPESPSRLSLLAIACSLTLLAACGSGSTVSRPAPAPAAQQHQQRVFDVRMQPQAEVTPGFRQLSSLSAPLALQALLPPPAVAARAALDADGTVSRDASSYSPVLPSNRVSKLGGFSEFTPDWDAAANPAAAGLAYCVYDLTLGQTPASATASLVWNESYTPAASDVYLGFSDWSQDRWVWYAMDADGTVTLPGLGAYIDPGQRMLVALVVGGEQRGLLQLLTLGQPEQRGTGMDDLLQPGSQFPPVYAPALPAAADLSPGCSPINDQQTWGACTAFAFGDGAYNYELNAIYGALGWDLTDPFNRVSPKYLYVKSGSTFGYPADPDYGRYMEDVGGSLYLDGVATEQSCPYDLVYAADWGAAANEDAGLLRISAHYAIPSAGPGGLSTIKAALAFGQKPVVLALYLDPAFFYYGPGDVWNFSGPAVGGHAMCIVGYDDARQAFKVRNSWSAAWGEDGYVWIGYPTFSNPSACAACYVIQDDYDPAVALRFTGNADALAPPAGVAASDGTLDSGVELTWTRTPGATGYKIYRDTRANLVATVGDLDSWLDATAAGQYSYCYWVRATDGPEESYYSASDLGYTAQAPQVTGVSPHGGSQGQSVTFQATAYGGGTVTYSWDFGSAAAPPTSTAAAPQVVLGAPGEYGCSVTVTNAKGSDQYDFALEIGDNLSPAAYFSATPDAGVGPLDVALDASNSFDPDGQIVLYQWSYDGDTVWEYEAATPLAQHTFTGVANHTVRLRVTDNSGNTDEDTTFVSVEPENFAPIAALEPSPPYGAAPLSVKFYSSSSYDPDGTIALYELDFEDDGVYDSSKTDSSFTQHVYAAAGSYTCRLRVTDDEGATAELTRGVTVGLAGLPPGWSHYQIGDQAYQGDSSLVSGFCTFGGVPAVMVQQPTDTAFKLYVASSANPAAPADWTAETPLAGVLLSTYALADVNGELCIAYRELGQPGLRFARRSAGTWVAHVLPDGGSQGLGDSIALATIAGKPAIACEGLASPGVRGVYYLRAASAAPSGAGDWTAMQLSTNPDSFGVMSLIEAGGVPQLLFRRRNASSELHLGFAHSALAEPAAAGDWADYEISTAWGMQDYAGLTMVNGKPALQFSVGGGTNETRLRKATLSVPAQDSDWTAYHVINNDSCSKPVSYLTLGGKPASCFTGSSFARLVTGTVPDPASYINWTRLDLVLWNQGKLVGGYATSADKAAVVIGSSGHKALYYAYQP